MASSAVYALKLLMDVCTHYKTALVKLLMVHAKYKTEKLLHPVKRSGHKLTLKCAKHLKAIF